MANVLILGATGAVGKHVFQQALACDKFAHITTVGRRDSDYDGPHKAKLSHFKVDFENLEASKSNLQGRKYDFVFCSLGTSRKEAGSAEAFVKIDQGYVLNASKLVPSPADAEFFYVSSLGANPSSSFLYPRTKGETERDLAKVGFKRVTIMRPGFLENAERKEPRIAERIVSPFVGIFKMISDNASVGVEKVAEAMVKLATGQCQHAQDGETVRIVNNADIIKMTKSS